MIGLRIAGAVECLRLCGTFSARSARFVMDDLFVDAESCDRLVDCKAVVCCARAPPTGERSSRLDKPSVPLHSCPLMARNKLVQERMVLTL